MTVWNCRWWRGTLSVLGLLPLMTCRPASDAPPADSVPTSNTLSVSSPSSSVQDCTVHLKTFAWRDPNRNGVQDAGKAPLLRLLRWWLFQR